MKPSELARALLGGAHIYVDCAGGRWNKIELVTGDIHQTISRDEYEAVGMHLQVDPPVKTSFMGAMLTLDMHGRIEVHWRPTYDQQFRTFRAHPMFSDELKAIAEGESQDGE